ncbi:gamma-glutamyltransferase [Pleurocapsa sp. CCALA 161]|uniref:gamma-glutamyltransferase n=1 Tax=Pleurocapsa sp. CCALA 161 TaxID=2107688 RepID=UPI000D075EAF|nr:gamma-glutamyltransferase [Pleurocapsa sp. CCALA 161]PSB07659.1 gamma-glutamyltransferase [Pleurocapsa sp. CCALA 161]
MNIKIKRAISLVVSIVLLIVMGNYLSNNFYLVYSTVDSWSKVNAKTVNTQALGTNGVVVSTQQDASAVGLEVLQDGGNAIDAAVAVGYALAVTDPCCGNLGGGGFMLIHLADGNEAFINFRETAPLKADSKMYLDERGKLRENLSTDGYLAVGVPGTVKGLNYALEQYGTMELKQVIEPAIDLAEHGFVLQAGDVDIFEAGKEKLLQPNVAKIFLQDDQKTYQVGDVLIQSDLANTLKALSQEGTEAFYQGEIAQKVVAASQKNKGILSLKDFSSYQVAEYEPISCNYRGYRVASSPPPGGGTTVCQMLNILSGYNLKELGWHTPQSLHHMFSSMLFAFGDRNRYLGDPDFVDNPTNKLLSAEYAASLREKIAFEALDPESVFSTDVPQEGTNTTHYSVVDKEGNAVAVTYTINSYFGAGVVAPGTGFLLNNEMDDFTTKLGSSNQFGLRQGSANLIEPGKRPLSSMSPTIVSKDGQVYLVTGSPGGSTIPTTVLQVITNVIDYGMNIADAVNSPRVHYQGLPNQVVAEAHAITPETFRGLKIRGYSTMPFMPWGAAESILVHGDKTMIGVNDIRKPAGKAVAY